MQTALRHHIQTELGYGLEASGINSFFASQLDTARHSSWKDLLRHREWEAIQIIHVTLSSVNQRSNGFPDEPGIS